MNQKEANEIVVSYLNPMFSERGYKYKKSKWNGFVKQCNEGFEYVNIRFYNYWPVQQPGYFISKRYNIVEDIYACLADRFDVNMPDKRTVGTFIFSYESLNNLGSIGYLEGGENEEDILADAKKIKDFMLHVGFPMLQQYDLKTIDAEINGNDFWKTDWRHKFTLGGGFHFKRMIIAKLCGNPNFNQLLQFHQTEHEETKKKYLGQLPKRVDGKTSMKYLVEVLLKNVDPVCI